MKRDLILFSIMFVAFASIFIISEMAIGPPGALINPSLTKTKTWSEVCNDLDRYAFNSLLLTAGIFYIRSKSSKKKK